LFQGVLKKLLKPKIVLVGGGGHCKVIVSILQKLDTFFIIGIADFQDKIGKTVLDVCIKYHDEDLKNLLLQNVEYAFISLGSIGDPTNRMRLFEMIKNIGFIFPVIISHESIVDKNIEIGEGTVVMPGVIINTGTKIGKNCIINTGSILDHDCILGDHVHIAPGVTLCGSVIVGNRSHIGSGVSVIQNISIGEDVLVAAGAVVVKDIRNNQKVFGIPAKAKNLF
jgi:sugar O-acyltransferase (sialic acid O-acetyltransferase NeuD family)